jgi:hypothetical protein
LVIQFIIVNAELLIESVIYAYSDSVYPVYGGKKRPLNPKEMQSQTQIIPVGGDGILEQHSLSIRGPASMCCQIEEREADRSRTAQSTTY